MSLTRDHAATRAVSPGEEGSRATCCAVAGSFGRAMTSSSWLRRMALRMLAVPYRFPMLACLARYRKSRSIATSGLSAGGMA